MRTRRSLLALLAPLALTAGCGAERADVGEVRVDADTPRITMKLTQAGITVELPRRPPPTRTEPPGAFRASLGGQALISGFAYRRREQIPKRAGEVRAARRRLIRAVETRDPDFKLIGSRITRVDGAPAVELRGDQTLLRGVLRTRSVHVYKGRAEYVFELLSPLGEFERNDREVMAPMLESLELTGRVRQKRRDEERKGEERRGEEPEGG